MSRQILEARSRAPRAGPRWGALGAGLLLLGLGRGGALPAPILPPLPETRAATRVETQVRPARVRAGQTALVTVTVRSDLGPPAAIDLDVGETALILTYSDGYSTSVGAAETVVERRFQVQATEPGRVWLQPVVVDAHGRDVAADPAALEVETAGLAWAPRAEPRAGTSDPRDQVLPEGVPPASSPDTRQVLPGGTPMPVWAQPLPYPSPYGPGRGGAVGGGPAVPYPGGPGRGGGPGGWPATPYPGGGVSGGVYGVGPGPGRPGAWSSAAAEDPWWPEVIPELSAFHEVVEDWTGTVRLGTGTTPGVVYPGQQLTHVATAAYLEGYGDVLTGSWFVPPAAPGLSRVPLPEVTGAAAAFRGEVALSHTYRTAYFADAPGTYELGPASLHYSLGRATRFRAPLDSIMSGPTTVQVMPIPVASAPPDWTGAVGRVRVEAFVDPPQVVEGQPALLIVRVLGAGRVEAFPPPVLEPVYGAEVVPLGEAVALDVRDGVLGGVKTFTYQLTPWEPGLIRVGPVVYAHFDPWVGDFGRVASGEPLLEVLPWAPRRP